MEPIRAGEAKRLACRVAEFSDQRPPALPSRVEWKYDGERILIQTGEDGIRLANRHNSLYLPEDLPNHLLSALRGLREGVYDGEFIDGDGRAGSFYKFLSSRTRAGETLRIRVFDVLELDGEDLRALPLSERIERLKPLIPIDGPVALAKGRTARDLEEIRAIFNEAVGEGYEGVVIKPLSSRYGDGAWMKLKAVKTIDAVILGITKTEAFRNGEPPHSFLIGFRDEDGYRPYGKVGTGLSAEEREAIAAILPAIKTGEDREFIHVRPFIVVELAYEAVLGNALRSPRIMRIRFDKPPSDCYAPHFLGEVSEAMVKIERIGAIGALAIGALYILMGIGLGFRDLPLFAAAAFCFVVGYSYTSESPFPPNDRRTS
ncbi:MAG: RNA ligase family protein [Candidatus Bathyarchaeia archaeon]